MGVSKVTLNGNTQIDVSRKTVNTNNLLSGHTALNSAGNDVTGAVNVPTKTSDLINDSGYITAAEAPVLSVNGQTGHVVISSTGEIIHVDTTANWNAQLSLVGESGHLYVYSDYQNVDGQDIPGVKVGDGNAYLIDAPFIGYGTEYLQDEHINDTDIHVTAVEKALWNNKVTCYISQDNAEILIFDKNRVNG